MKLGILGVGNMGGAILMGMLKQAAVSSKDVVIYNRSPEKIEKFVELGVSVAKDELDLVSNSDILLLGVKPKDFEALASRIKDHIKEDALIISIAAGISTQRLQELFDRKKCVRVMPNTPALIGQGMTAISRNEDLSEDNLYTVKEIFDVVGETAIIEENLMEAFSSISGCMPAFVDIFIEATADAAVSEGIKREDAYKYISKAVAGSAQMVYETGQHPGVLKDQVCSPSGSTIKGVLALERDGFRNAVINAILESKIK